MGGQVSGAVTVPAEHFERVMATLMEQMEEHARRSQAAQVQAIADGIRATVTDPAVLRAVIDEVAKAAQERATAAAGRGVWWLIRSAASRWLLIVVIVAMVAKFLGWDIAAKVGRFLTGATA